MNPQPRFGVAVICLGLIVPTLSAQAARDVLATDAVQTVAKFSASVDPVQLVETLTHRFGPRLTGSKSERRAAAWAQGEMEGAGLSHVHQETWTMHRGWKRLHAYARLEKPFDSELNVASYGWSGSTSGPVSGEVVLVDGDASFTEASTHQWTGKIVLVAPLSKDGIQGVADAPVLARWAEESHALAVIDGIPRPGAVLHTGPLGYPGLETSVPMLDMPAAERKRLEQLVKQGVRPRIRLDVANQFTTGPVQAENVIGEIQGSEYPEQVVVLGAHLDSWDLSSGATDDGTGVATVISAAQLIHKSGVRPRRTIRFVLFTGEEQGLLGSHAYVERHRVELANTVCALVMDWGAGPVKRFLLAGHPELKEPLQELFRVGDTFQSIEAAPGFLTFTDAFSFTLAGIPGIGLLQESPTYDKDAHSTEDTLQAMNPPALRSNTEVLAQTAVWLADVTRRPGTIFTPVENELALKPVRSALQMLGDWPYLHDSGIMQPPPDP